MNKLPLYGCWNTGEFQKADEDAGYTPGWQYPRILGGHPLHPTFEIPFRTLASDDRERRAHYFEPLWSHARDNKLPLVLIGTNLEDGFRQLEPWKSMIMGPGSDHPFIETEQGTILPVSSPWRENMHHWHSYGVMFGNWLQREYADDYPDCPYIFIGNNNEIGRATPEQAVMDPAMPEVLEDRPMTELNHEISVAYAMRRGEFMVGLRTGCPSWGDRIHIYAYSESGTEHQRVEVDETERRYRFPWAGPDGNVEFLGFDATVNTGYIQKWGADQANNLRGPQVKACNSKAGYDMFRLMHPGFEFETHFWNGRRDSSEIWGGVVTCVLWIMRTQRNRLFLGSTEKVADTYVRDMRPLETAVRAVHENPVLTRFWQEGKLLMNRWARDYGLMPLTEIEKKWMGVTPEKVATGYGHPYQWKSGASSETSRDPAERWFLQTTSADNRLQYREHPSGERWSYWEDLWRDDRGHKQELPVAAICLEAGGEHLIYAHAPSGRRNGVTIHVSPDGHDPLFSVVTDVPVAGRFLYRDSDGVVTPVDWSVEDDFPDE